jgi:hypothetical protein
VLLLQRNVPHFLGSKHKLPIPLAKVSSPGHFVADDELPMSSEILSGKELCLSMSWIDGTENLGLPPIACRT